MFIQNLVIFGVGLIGGSVAKALRQANAVGVIHGVDRAPTNLNRALENGIIDKKYSRTSLELSEVIRNADLIVIAVPVGQTASIFKKILPNLTDKTVITDVGSTKEAVVKMAERYLHIRAANFVPGHPIAGAESRGVLAASSELFVGKDVILTPIEHITKAKGIKFVAKMWETCGARVVESTPQEHDAIFASVSHLPHLLAFSFVAEIANKRNAKELFQGAGSGFRDFTRIAGSQPKMWRDICLENREVLIQEVENFQRQLSDVLHLLKVRDGKELEEIFETASNARNKWVLAKKEGEN